MINITATIDAIRFESNVTGGIIDTNFLEPKWEVVDDNSYHINTDQGTFLINVNTHSLNGNKYSSSSDAIDYLSNIK